MQSDPDLVYSLDLADRLAREVLPDVDPDIAKWDLLVDLGDALQALGIEPLELDWDGYLIAPADVERVFAEAARRIRADGAS